MGRMRHLVDFTTVSEEGLTSSPVAAVLAGLRANEARYYKNKYDHDFALGAAEDESDVIEWVSRILHDEKGITIASRPLEATRFEVAGLLIVYVFYESGLSINVMYSIDTPARRAVGIKLSDGMDVPAELVDRFRFARQKSRLAGTIRGSYFVIKGEY